MPTPRGPPMSTPVKQGPPHRVVNPLLFVRGSTERPPDEALARLIYYLLRLRVRTLGARFLHRKRFVPFRRGGTNGYLGEWRPPVTVTLTAAAAEAMAADAVHE